MQAGWFETVNTGLALRAGHFIVTLYGDVVEPRGGRLWMGNIIETCAEVGISETLVRTAVSRLVRAGKLRGQRVGRRSFYALTAAAQAEFAQAARLLFDPQRHEGWAFVHSTVEIPVPFVRLGEGWWLGPADAVPREAGVVFEAQLARGAQGFAALTQGLFALEALGQAYAAFCGHFGALGEGLAAAPTLSPAEALKLRLLLVDRFRAIALKDALWPVQALLEDWSGRQARQLFVRLYAALSPAADAHVARHFVSADGPLPCFTEASLRRAQTLAASV